MNLYCIPEIKKCKCLYIDEKFMKAQLALLFLQLKKRYSISDEIAEYLITKLKVVEIAKGKNLFVQNRFSDKVYYVIKGSFRGYSVLGDDTEITNYFAPASNFKFIADFGAVRNNQMAGFTVQALENSVVLQWDYADITRMYQLFPEANELARIILEEQYINMIFAVKMMHQMNVTDRYKYFCEKFPAVINKVSQIHIASYLGVTPVHLSRIKNKRGSDFLQKKF